MFKNRSYNSIGGLSSTETKRSNNNEYNVFEEFSSFKGNLQTSLNDKLRNSQAQQSKNQKSEQQYQDFTFKPQIKNNLSQTQSSSLFNQINNNSQTQNLDTFLNKSQVSDRLSSQANQFRKRFEDLEKISNFQLNNREQQQEQSQTSNSFYRDGNKLNTLKQSIRELSNKKKNLVSSSLFEDNYESRQDNYNRREQQQQRERENSSRDQQYQSTFYPKQQLNKVWNDIDSILNKPQHSPVRKINRMSRISQDFQIDNYSDYNNMSLDSSHRLDNNLSRYEQQNNSRFEARSSNRDLHDFSTNLFNKRSNSNSTQFLSQSILKINMNENQHNQKLNFNPLNLQRVVELQDLLTDIRDDDFNQLPRQYIDELLKLSSIIMVRVKSSQFYKRNK